MLFDPANGPDFKTAKTNIMKGKIFYSIMGTISMIGVMSAFYAYGGIIQGEKVIKAFEKEEENNN